MKNLSVVSFENALEAHTELVRGYQVALEINDFYDPDVLDNVSRTEAIMTRYRQVGIPAGSTMHGAFLDVILHSRDAFVRENSAKRMRQSMEIAKALNLEAVVFHINYNPAVVGEDYFNGVVHYNSQFVAKLLTEYPSINIYLENMFEDDPKVLTEISANLSQYPNYGVCLDYAHAVVYGSDIDRWVKELAPYVKHIHINDNDLKRDLHLAVGSGAINWEEFASYYAEYFTHCRVLIEVCDAHRQRESLEFLKDLL